MALPISITKPRRDQRIRDLSIFGGLALWLVYTRVYWALHAAHFTLPPCPFYYVTGHPCPFCGGTRSFAYMWQGDISDAVRLYPLGPALFVGTILGTGGLAAGLVTGRTWSQQLTSRHWRLLSTFGVSALLISWALKVFILGN
jgi:hypothetical protein